MGSSDMMDEDVFALFPGNWLTDKVFNHLCLNVTFYLTSCDIQAIITFLKVTAIYSSELVGLTNVCKVYIVVLLVWYQSTQNGKQPFVASSFCTTVHAVTWICHCR